MYVNRGMLEAAKNEGEMAGVMAHEISHVALRHATAQATKQSSAKNTAWPARPHPGRGHSRRPSGCGARQLSGPRRGQQNTAVLTSRRPTSLGAHIMADAGYDPHDLANMFQTIQQQSGGGGGPSWLSSHPDSGNRYAAINKEAQSLHISANPIKVTPDFQRTKERFRSMPRGRTMSEIEKGPPMGGNNYPSPGGNGYPDNGGNNYPNSGGNRYPDNGGNQYPGNGGNNSPSSAGRYSASVQHPSTSMRPYTGVKWLRVNIPTNWIDLTDREQVQFAPEGAYGDQGITRGVMFGVFTGANPDLQTASEEHLNGLLAVNSYLRQRGSFIETTLGGRDAYTAMAMGTSPVTNKTERVTVYTTQLRNNGGIFYVVTVVPEDEAFAYNSAFRNILNSIQINEH